MPKLHAPQHLAKKHAWPSPNRHKKHLHQRQSRRNVHAPVTPRPEPPAPAPQTACPLAPCHQSKKCAHTITPTSTPNSTPRAPGRQSCKETSQNSTPPPLHPPPLHPTVNLASGRKRRPGPSRSPSSTRLCGRASRATAARMRRTAKLSAVGTKSRACEPTGPTRDGPRRVTCKTPQKETAFELAHERYKLKSEPVVLNHL